jgi:NADPH-dependent curcumin reductase CurA
MSSAPLINRKIVLNSRPVGAPTAENFRLEEAAIAAPAAGQVLLRTLYLSLDPYMRGRMSDAASYAAPVALGGVMVGATVSRVEASQHPDFKEATWFSGKAAGRATPSPTAAGSASSTRQ